MLFVWRKPVESNKFEPARYKEFSMEKDFTMLLMLQIDRI